MHKRTLSIKERVVAGLVAARARGHIGGRRPKLSAAQQRQAHHLKQGGMTITAIAQTLNCSRHTIYSALRSVQSTSVSV
jgi:DNA invertase Pin-like site-specific DNA recombinase